MSMWQEPNFDFWHGRVDQGDQDNLTLRWHQVVEAWEDDPEPGVALIGFASDQGVIRNHGRAGAQGGPMAIRRALANMAWHSHKPLYDAGDIVTEGFGLEDSQQKLAEAVNELLAHKQLPIVLGGGHEMAYGSFVGLAEWFSEIEHHAPSIGIINFDAHFDLRASEEASSGTPFYQISHYCEKRNWPFQYLVLGIAEHSNTQALFNRADKLDVHYRLDEQMSIAHLEDIRAQLKDFIAQCEHIYLSIDLDVFPAALAPGVSAPAARGVNLDVIEPLIEDIKASQKLSVFDIAEMNPEFDLDHRTARLAARLVHLVTRESR